MYLKRPVVAAVAAAALLGLTACGGSTDPSGSSSADGAAGSTEDRITLYSGRNEGLVQPIIDRFVEETGIAVDVRYGNTAAMAAQLLEEGDKSPADIFLAQDAGALGAVAEAGLFEPLPESLLESVPAEFRDDDGEWTGVTARARVLVYNKDMVEEADLPATVEELNSTEYAGKVGVAPSNASFQSFVTALREMKGDEAAKKYLEDLAGNDPAIRDGNNPIVADVNAGKIPFGLVNHYYLYELAKEQGVDAEELKAANHMFTGGDVGALVNISGVGLIKHAADDEASQLLEYFLSPEGQQYFAEETSEYPMLEDVAGPKGLPALTELDVPDVDLNNLDDLETTIKMITEAGLA